MHPYLTRLGVDMEVQQYFAPSYQTDKNGNLVFDYKGETETYGFAFHRIPVSNHFWKAGHENIHTAGQIFICNSAMEAISFLTIRRALFPDSDRLLFLAIGAAVNVWHLQWLIANLPGKKCTLVFGNDFLGRIIDFKIAAAICKIPVAIRERDEMVTINFRYQNYTVDTKSFSLNNVEKLTGYRFGIRTIKPKGHFNFFEQLKDRAY